MTVKPRWELQQGYGPHWAGSERIDGDWSTLALFMTKPGARWWAWSQGLAATRTFRIVRIGGVR